MSIFARIAMYCGAAAETELSMSHFDAALRYIERAIRLEREDGRQMKLRVRLAQKAAILLGMKQHRPPAAGTLSPRQRLPDPHRTTCQGVGDGIR